ncbi:hypothetical protein [Pseudomonas sp. zfem002]|uniref:hypothetical protein n=1 Tax=Pseudomonas sp. zfem002 TaxID=3078197 RepID=UPI00292944E2|nr:hypothetical protein [Pseudomonas sp. zfem002]MDU9393921.1 hypothetical protein [Pseudomonas sp. zfem002]
MKVLNVLVIASVISLPLHAAEAPKHDYCQEKIAQLDHIERTDGMGVQGGVATSIRRLIEQARAAQAKGDAKACLAAANQALSLYQTATH